MPVTLTKRPKAPLPPDALLLTYPAAAQVLQLSRGTIYNLAKSGHLTLVKIGKNARITRASVEALAQHRQQEAA
jgi:excisionase family DNA binding protein